jgi:bacterioferritin-associated ferredoxin
MAENLDVLIGIQEQIAQCRRLAAEIFDPETAKRLRMLADEMEQRAREVDDES